MNKVSIILAASFVALALLPLVAANPGSCASSPKNDGIAHPLRASHYIYIGTPPSVSVGPPPGVSLGSINAQELSEWRESNEVSGLQVTRCFEFGVYHYGADDFVAKLLPA